MKFDIKLNGKKYIVEIGNSSAMILEKHKDLESQGDDITDIDVPDFDFSKAEDDSNALISAPLPGTVIAISVKNGDRVTKGQRLIVLESMKMENEIVAPADGKIDDIFVSVGSSVKKDQVLIALKVLELTV